MTWTIRRDPLAKLQAREREAPYNDTTRANSDSGLGKRISGKVVLELLLAIVGGVGGIIGSLVWLFEWKGRFWPKLLLATGIVTALGGVHLWDYEERKEDWILTDNEKKILTQELSRINHSKFIVVFFPLNAEPLAHRMAYSVLDSFISANWKYVFVSPNWVVPKGSHGIDIRQCPNLPSELTPAVNTERKLLINALLPVLPYVTDTEQTEQFLDTIEVENPVTRITRKCPIGLIFGQPPPPCARTNHSAPRLPNIWCKLVGR